jgi:hypothetical protein
MSEPETMAERHARQLARYAEIASAAAEKAGAAIAACEDPERLPPLIGALQKAGRSLRQTILLEAKLAADAAKGPDKPPNSLAVARRSAQVRDAVTRIIRHRVEPLEVEALLSELDIELHVALLDDIFTEVPLDDDTLDIHVAHLILRLALPAEFAFNWRDLPQAPDPRIRDDALGPHDTG